MDQFKAWLEEIGIEGIIAILKDIITFFMSL